MGCVEPRQVQNVQLRIVLEEKKKNVFLKELIIYSDVVGPLKASRGFKYLLTIRDGFTRWLEIFPLKDLKAITIAKIVNDEIFCR